VAESLPYAALFPLEGAIRDYSWGSRTAIPQLLGRPESGGPAAELWLGAHPADPSPIQGARTDLAGAIAADPVTLLGADVIARFGPQLPFLVKVIAPAKALSIQVHPNREQARAGFAAEDARGIRRDDPTRNYPDPNHKPEMLYALNPFEAFCGFRPVAGTLRLLEALAAPELAPFHAVLSERDGLRRTFTFLVGLDSSHRQAVVAAVVAGCERVAGTDGEWTAAADAVLRIAQDFPTDIGLALVLLLNHIRLEPGDAIYLGAGNLHCYVRGLAVEVMANSDNVLRGGLTPKHIDVPELLAVTDFVPLPDPLIRPRVVEEEAWFDVPVPDFRLAVHEVAGLTRIPPTGPQILLCTRGEAYVTAGGEHRSLPRGSAAFVAAGRGLQLSGRATVFRASVVG
jgi:mannose-6-phosphate isomerase